MSKIQTDVVQPTLKSSTNNFPMSDYCGLCANFNATSRNCSAFPNGIPVVIYFGEFDHRKPFEGDKGIRFKASRDFPEGEKMLETSLDWRKKNPRVVASQVAADAPQIAAETAQSRSDASKTAGNKLAATLRKLLNRGKAE